MSPVYMYMFIEFCLKPSAQIINILHKKLKIKAHIPLEIDYPTQMKSTQKIWNVHTQREKFAFGTQRNLYSTVLCWGLALGLG